MEAVGKLSEALKTVEIARGHQYAIHQLNGHADFQVGDAIRLLRAAGHAGHAGHASHAGHAGHAELADELARELVGRNVLPGRWTFEVIEEYATCYSSPSGCSTPGLVS